MVFPMTSRTLSRSYNNLITHAKINKTLIQKPNSFARYSTACGQTPSNSACSQTASNSACSQTLNNCKYTEDYTLEAMVVGAALGVIIAGAGVSII